MEDDELVTDVLEFDKPQSEEDELQIASLMPEEEEEYIPASAPAPAAVSYPQSTMTPALLRAIIGTESDFNPNAQSHAGAQGLMQVMPDMWRAYGGGPNPYDPKENVRIGTAIYDDEFVRFKGNRDLALAAYNAGSPAVIRALNAAGYDLKDSGLVSFDAIKAYLPEETQNYVPKINKSMRTTQSEDATELPTSQDIAIDQANGNLGTYAASKRGQPFVAGTKEELKAAVLQISADPEFSNMPAAEALAMIKQVYDSKPYWTSEAKDYLKQVSNSIWDTAYPNEKPDIGSLVGETPRLKGDETPKQIDQLFGNWRTKRLEDLKNQGIDPILMGDAVDNYFNAAIEDEKTANRYRQRGLIGGAIARIGNFAANASKGLISGTVGGVEGAARLAGAATGVEALESTADYIAKFADVVPEGARDLNVEVNDQGYVLYDEYGKPKTKWTSSIAQAIGQVGSVFVGAGAVGKAAQFLSTATNLAKGEKLVEGAVKGYIGATNVLQNANEAFKDAKENGGTNQQALTAAAFSLPSSAIDSLGDFMVLGGGKAWIKGLSTYDKARAIGLKMAEGFVVEGSTEAAQQYLQDVGTSAAINYDVTSWAKVGQAFVAGGIAGGLAKGIVGTTYEVRPEERNFIPAVTNDTQGKEPPAGGATTPQRFIVSPDGTTVADTGQSLADPHFVVHPNGTVVANNGKIVSRPTDKLPIPEEHERLAREFTQFSQSPDMEKVIRLRSDADLDTELVNLFGLETEKQNDGSIKLRKLVTYIPPDTTNVEPTELDIQIQKLARELMHSPKPQDAERLIRDRRIAQETIARIHAEEGPRANANSVLYTDLKNREAEIVQNLTRLNREAKKLPEEQRQMIQLRKADAREELRKVRDEIENFDPGESSVNSLKNLRDLVEAKATLAQTNAALKLLSDPNNIYVNNRQLKENTLSRMIVQRDGEAVKAAAQKKQATQDVDAKKAQQLENLQRGLVFTDKRGNKKFHILPFEGRWYVLNDTGDPLARGFNSYTDALEHYINKGLGSSFTDRLAVNLTPTLPSDVDVPEEFTENNQDSVEGTADSSVSDSTENTKKRSKQKETSSLDDGVSGLRTSGSSEQTPSTATSSTEETAEARGSQPIKSRLRKSVVNPGVTLGKKFTEGETFTQDNTKVTSPREVISKIQKIAKSLSKSNPSLVREGGPIKRGLLGYINQKRRYIRIGESNDVPTAVHEIAHAVNFDLFPDWSVFPKDIQNALSESARAFYPDGGSLSADKQLQEGWSMFVQHYMTGQPVNKKLLDFYNGWFKTEHPEIYKSLEDLKRTVYDYYNQTPQAWAEAFTSATNERQRKINITDFKDDYINRMSVLQDIDKVAGTNISDAIEANQGSAREKLDYVMNRGISDFDGNIVPGALSLKEALAPAKGQMQELTNYLVANYTIARGNRGQTTGMALDDAVAIKGEIERTRTPSGELQYQGVIDAANNYYTWNQNVLDIVAKRNPFMANFIENIRADNLKHTGSAHGFYIPFAREFTETPSGKEQGGIANAPSAMKRFKGSTKRIVNPLKVIERSTGNLLAATEQRYALDQLHNLARSGAPLGQFIVKVDPAYVPTLQASVKELQAKLNQQLREAGQGEISVGDDPELLNNLVSFFRPQVNAPRSADGYATYAYPTKDGLEFYEVHPRIIKAFDNSTPDWTKNAYFDFLYRKPAKLLRLGATTFRTAYQLRNFLFRDFSTAYRRSNTWNPIALFAETMNALKGQLGTSLSGGKWVDGWTDLAQRLGAEASTLQKAGRDIEASLAKSTGNKVITIGGGTVNNTLNYLESVLSSGERATRTAAMRMRLKELGVTDPKQKLTPAQAIEAVLAYKRSTTNFGIQGAKARHINLGIPFFTARIAELSQLKTDLKKNPGKFAAYATSAIALGMYQAFANNDEEWWQNLEPVEKAMNFLTTKEIGGAQRVIRIPLETVSGTFNAIGVMLTESLIRTDSLAPGALEQMSALAKTYSPLGHPADLLGPVIKEAVQQIANKDFYFDSDIVPRSLIDAPPTKQFTAATTEFSKALGEATGQSPARIDHWIRSTFPAALDWVKGVEHYTGVKPINENNLDPITAAITRPGYASGIATRASNKFYDLRAELTAVKDAETPQEATVRKKLDRIAEAASDYSVLLSAVEDAQERQELQEARRKLFMEGIELAEGLRTSVSIQAGLSNKAERIRKQQKADRINKAKASREASSDD